MHWEDNSTAYQVIHCAGNLYAVGKRCRRSKRCNRGISWNAARMLRQAFSQLLTGNLSSQDDSELLGMLSSGVRGKLGLMLHVDRSRQED